MFVATVTRTYYCYDDCPKTIKTVMCDTALDALKLEDKLFYESECEDTCHSTSWFWDDDSWNNDPELDKWISGCDRLY